VAAGWFVLAGILTFSAYLNVRTALISDSGTEYFADFWRSSFSD